MNSGINAGSSSNIMLVVLYKMQPTASLTIQSIKNYLQAQDSQSIPSFRLFIWDNSPNSSEVDIEFLRAQLPALEIVYVHTPDNYPLSKIYNEVASTLSLNEYLTLLDQDTVLPFAYFEELRLAQSDQWPLILPKVECQNILVSPGSRFFAQGIRLKEIKSGAVSSKNLLAINSGMSILSIVFQSFKYDERLRFYGTDTFFMRKYEKCFNQAFVLETPISHSLAVMEQKSQDWHSAYTRELIRTLDIIYTNSILEVLFVRIYIIYIRLKYFMRNCC